MMASAVVEISMVGAAEDITPFTPPLVGREHIALTEVRQTRPVGTGFEGRRAELADLLNSEQSALRPSPWP